MQEGLEHVMQTIDRYGISVDFYFVDSRLNSWLLPTSALYANTPTDIEFKLPEIGLYLGDAGGMAAHIRGAADVAFPVIHGVFGEDGELQRALAAAGVPYVGSEAPAACRAFNKRTARDALLEDGFPALHQTFLLGIDFVSEEGAITVR
jgi:D-alanine-D-alanine ligase-like ATP-grasp enzyme